MFEQVEAAPPDPIIGLTEAFKNDTHPEKINLGVGVYKDQSGLTPILECVKEAERTLVSQETTKSYLAIDGSPDYGRYVQELFWSQCRASSRWNRRIARCRKFFAQDVSRQKNLDEQPHMGESLQRVSSGRPGYRKLSLL